jgi:hypothetical protein
MSKIIDAQDILAFARFHIECVFMAAGQLEREDCDPIQAVADTASRKIGEAIALIEEYRKAGDADDNASLPAAPERRRQDRRQAREIAREAELLAFVANDIREHHCPEAFPWIIAKIELYQSPAYVTALRRALYS